MSIRTRIDDNVDPDMGEPGLYVSCDALTYGDYGGYGSIGVANVRTLEDTEGAWTEHGCYGYVTLWLPGTEENRELVRQLDEDYPVVDDGAVSQVEMEWEEEAWDSYGQYDISREMKTVFNHPYGEWLQDVVQWLAADVAKGLYWECMSSGRHSVTYENSGACLPLDDIAEEYGNKAQAVFFRAIADTLRPRYESGEIGNINPDDPMDCLVCADALAEQGEGELSGLMRDRAEMLTEAREQEAEAAATAEWFAARFAARNHDYKGSKSDDKQA